MGDRYVLMFSKINEIERASIFVVGDFVDGKLVNYTISRPEWGRDFYAPQTFTDGKRRIMIGWMFNWERSVPEGCPFAGALTIPRELRLVDDHVYNFPVEEASVLLKQESDYVRQEKNGLILMDRMGNALRREIPELKTVDILEDIKSVEVFVNGGEQSFSWWIV